ncbi:MAG: DNA polymerase/3'-5' exonuclease PolX, partial [Planctomycetota bacterium]
KLLEQVPVGLLDVMSIPGLGPKTVRLLWEQAGVTDIDTLKEALDEGKLEALPRMGEKTVQNIRSAIAFAEKAGRRVLLGRALPLAEGLVERLGAVKGVKQIVYAGSLRRGKETIGDVDLLAQTDEPRALVDAFTTMPGVDRVLVAGSTKCSVRLGQRLQIDLRIVPAESFGAALLYFTGSKQHNVRLRERAIKQGLRLNEYGLFDAEEKAVAGKSEQEVFAALGLPEIPPELREDRGELELTETPPLLTLSDIRSELHTHTRASDGRMSIDDIAETAKRHGFHTVAVTDHSKSSVQANGLSPERLRAHVEAIRTAAERHDDVTLLAGCEVDILTDGALDYDDDLLAELDVVIASPHAALRQDPATATKRLLRAIRHPLVHVLGHPTGRIIGRREGLEPDMTQLIKAAAECNVALEINANPLRLDLRDTHVKAAIDAGCLIAINTDAHSPDQFDYLRYGVVTARRGWVTAERCINAWDRKKLHDWLQSKR